MVRRAAGRTLTSPQQLLIERSLHTKSNLRPLYLKLLFEEVKVWRSYDKSRLAMAFQRYWNKSSIG